MILKYDNYRDAIFSTNPYGCKKGEVCACCPHRRGSHFACVSMNTFSQPLFFGMICFILFAKVGVIFQSNKFF